ncbi:hypothetical protein FB599_3953 [Herbaspirillum sp. SJZ130]|nr:hypothetical protein FB599_3953 [Herbaspirillum sp. SJZ130]TQK05856.1 hypothetical protein FB598_3893 [Herbaspirillum sp. SJZ106]
MSPTGFSTISNGPADTLLPELVAFESTSLADVAFAAGAGCHGAAFFAVKDCTPTLPDAKGFEHAPARAPPGLPAPGIAAGTVGPGAPVLGGLRTGALFTELFITPPVRAKRWRLTPLKSYGGSESISLAGSAARPGAPEALPGKCGWQTEYSLYQKIAGKWTLPALVCCIAAGLPVRQQTGVRHAFSRTPGNCGRAPPRSRSTPSRAPPGSAAARPANGRLRPPASGPRRPAWRR